MQKWRIEGVLDNADARFTRSTRTMPAIREESSGSSQLSSIVRPASPSDSLASLVADNGAILEESLPEMVRLYRARLSAIDDEEMSESLLEDFDRILVLKNKRLWKVTQHLTQKMKETAEFYRAIVDNKDYQLQLYRNRIKALVQQLLDVLSTSDKQDQIPPELMNPFLLNILTELSAGDGTSPLTEGRANVIGAEEGHGNMYRSASDESQMKGLRMPNCLLPDKLLCRSNCKRRDKS